MCRLTPLVGAASSRERAVATGSRSYKEFLPITTIYRIDVDQALALGVIDSGLIATDDRFYSLTPSPGTLYVESKAVRKRFKLQDDRGECSRRNILQVLSSSSTPQVCNKHLFFVAEVASLSLVFSSGSLPSKVSLLSRWKAEDCIGLS
jgi:hypothetical protein